MNLFFIKLIELVYKCIDSISMVSLEIKKSLRNYVEILANIEEARHETRFVKCILFSKIQFQNHYMNESVLFRV